MGRAIFIWLAFGTTALGIAASGASAQQANRHTVTRWVSAYCQESMPDDLRELVAQAKKTVPEVCDCTGEGLWKRFPGETYWYSETFAGQQIDEAFMPTLIGCIVE